MPTERRVYLDTNVFVNAVEGTVDAAGAPRKLLDFLRERPGMAVTSEITLAEVLAPARRADALPLHVKRRTYLNLILWSSFVTLIPITRDVLIETADLRAVALLKLADAIHIVSAIRANCTFVVSDDGDFRKVPDGMTFCRPDAVGVDVVLESFS